MTRKHESRFTSSMGVNLTEEQDKHLSERSEALGIGKGSYLRILLSRDMEKAQKMERWFMSSMKGLAEATEGNPELMQLMLGLNDEQMEGFKDVDELSDMVNCST